MDIVSLQIGCAMLGFEHFARVALERFEISPWLFGGDEPVGVQRTTDH